MSLRFCRIDQSEVTDQVIEQCIHESPDSICEGPDGERIVTFIGNKPTSLYGKEELTQTTVVTLLQDPTSGYSTPFEISDTEAANLPDELLFMLNYTQADIDRIRS